MRASLCVSLILIVGCASPVASQDVRSRFLETCRSELIAANPQGAAWADQECGDRWTAAMRSNPVADALLLLFKEEAAPARTAAEVRARSTPVNWSGPQGRLGPFVASVDDPDLALNLAWQAQGEPSPFDVPSALRVRGAQLTRIGCYGFGFGEQTHVYRVDLAGHAPFALTVYSREAPTASAFSSYSVSARADRVIPTLAQLQADPDVEWRPDCG